MTLIDCLIDLNVTCIECPNNHIDLDRCNVCYISKRKNIVRQLLDVQERDELAELDLLIL